MTEGQYLAIQLMKQAKAKQKAAKRARNGTAYAVQLLDDGQVKITLSRRGYFQRGGDRHGFYIYSYPHKKEVANIAELFGRPIISNPTTQDQIIKTDTPKGQKIVVHGCQAITGIPFILS